MCINHSGTDKLTRLQPHDNGLPISFLTENPDCVVSRGGHWCQISYFPCLGGNNADMIGADSESAGKWGVDEGADDNEVAAGAKGELGRHCPVVNCGGR